MDLYVLLTNLWRHTTALCWRITNRGPHVFMHVLKVHVCCHRYFLLFPMLFSCIFVCTGTICLYVRFVNMWRVQNNVYTLGTIFNKPLSLNYTWLSVSPAHVPLKLLRFPYFPPVSHSFSFAGPHLTSLPPSPHPLLPLPLISLTPLPPLLLRRLLHRRWGRCGSGLCHQVPHSSRSCGGLGPHGEVLGAVHLQVPPRRARGPLLLADWASTQHTREQRVHGRDHVWEFQRSWSLHCSAGVCVCTYVCVCMCVCC